MHIRFTQGRSLLTFPRANSDKVAEVSYASKKR